MWVSNQQVETKIFAYGMATKERDEAKDFDTLAAAGNNYPRGIWSDGTTMWVVDLVAEKLLAYDMTTKERDAAKDFDTLAPCWKWKSAGYLVRRHNHVGGEHPKRQDLRLWYGYQGA